MSGAEDRLVARWTEAAVDLGLEITAPFELALKSGTRIRVPLLLRHFGASRGLLIVTDYSLVQRWKDEIVQAGHGFSVLSEPGPCSKYARQEFIELLTDWGWTGAVSHRPAWLRGGEDPLGCPP